MGFLGGLLGGGMDDPVRGTAQVVSATGYHEGVMQTCRMQLVLRADGVPPTAVSFSGLVHNKRWPQPGMVLPVTVDRANPERYKIEWGEVKKSSESARESAEGLAAAMRGDGAPSGQGGILGGAQVINLSGGDVSQPSEEQLGKLRMLGLDPDQLAAQQGSAPSPPAPAPPERPEDMDDRLGQLERLGRLREQGILTDAEFEAQKKQILE